MTSVYRYIDKDGVVLYVGCTNNLKKRNAGHRSKLWYGNVHSIEVELFASRDDAATHELKVINAIRPLHNKNLVSRAPTVFENEEERNAYHLAQAEAVIRSGTKAKGMREAALWVISKSELSASQTATGRKSD